MHRKTLATALAAALALGGLGALPALADDAGSVRNQSPAYAAWKSDRQTGAVARGSTFSGLFAADAEPIEAWSSDAERQRRLRGDFPAGM